MAINDGGPFYPTDAFIDKGQPGFPAKSASKLEVYALAAMQGLCANPAMAFWLDDEDAEKTKSKIKLFAYDMAADMLTEHERRMKGPVQS